MLRIKSMIYLTGQANNNVRNSKSQTKKQSRCFRPIGSTAQRKYGLASGS